MWWKFVFILYGNGRCLGDSTAFELDVALCDWCWCCCDVEVDGGNPTDPVVGIIVVDMFGDIGSPAWCAIEWLSDDGNRDDGDGWVVCLLLVVVFVIRFLFEFVLFAAAAVAAATASELAPFINWWKLWKSLVDGRNDAKSTDVFGSLRASGCHSPVAVTVVQCHGLV